MDICSDDTKTMGGGVKLSTCLHDSTQRCQTALVTVFFTITHLEVFFFFLSVSPFKNVLDGAIGMINFIKYKNVCWNGRYFRGTQGLSQEKALKQLSELQVTGRFFPPMGYIFT